MKQLVLVSLFVSVATATFLYDLGGGYSLTSIQKDTIATDIENTIYSVREPDEDGNQFYPFIAGFVRLAFHQCISGKCTGCINLNDPNNLHLRRYVDALEAVRLRNPFIRYGDLWALAGIVALRVSERLTNAKFGWWLSYTQLLQFRYGREDCPTAPYTTDVYPFPSFSKGLDHVLSYFSVAFDLRESEVVALLGAHALGGLRHPTSDRIINQWVSSADILSNAYYVAMADSRQNWQQSAHAISQYSSPVFFWTNGSNKRLMFNSDMCMYKNLTFVNNNEGQASCTYGSCKPASTAYWVSVYAASNDLWLAAFMPAYMKMTERGYPIFSLKSPKFCVLGICLW